MFILGMAGQVIGAGIDAATAIGNYQNQIDQTQYMKEMQQQQWAREDNAIQRRVADMVAAGLSPTLAAGNAAQSSSPIKIDAPEYQGPSAQDKALQMQQLALNLESQKANIAQTNAQTQAIMAQAKNTELKTRFETETYGDRMSQITLQNELSRGNITSKTLDNIFAQETAQDRMQIIKNEVEKYGLYKVTNEIENRAKEAGIKLTTINTLAKELQYKWQTTKNSKGMTPMDIEAASMDLALEILKNQRLQSNWDTDIKGDIHTDWQVEGKRWFKANRAVDFYRNVAGGIGDTVKAWMPGPGSNRSTR